LLVALSGRLGENDEDDSGQGSAIPTSFRAVSTWRHRRGAADLALGFPTSSESRFSRLRDQPKAGFACTCRFV